MNRRDGLATSPAKRARGDSRARPSQHRRTSRASRASSRRSRGARPAFAATSPAVIASPPASAARTEALVAPGGVRRAGRVGRVAGLRLRRGVLGCSRRLRAPCSGFGRSAGFEDPGPSAVSALRSRSASLDELVEALLDLFTQTVDHVSVSSRWGAGDRTRTRSPEVNNFPRGPSHRPPHHHTRTAAPLERDGR